MFIVDYMKKMNTFAQNLAAQPAINVDLILPIQGGLGTEYDTLVVSVTSRSEQTALADLQGLLFSHEYRQQIAPNKQHLPAMVDLNPFAFLPSSRIHMPNDGLLDLLLGLVQQGEPHGPIRECKGKSPFRTLR
ncbi:hypothetical protein FXO38_24302 [Capsicum annuum]|nr:hypothetical protein FXO38_24302 [Capsicum annuum]KAF3656340.1 hypothetical protein FXO37_15520 [Capsicum annuum]